MLKSFYSEHSSHKKSNKKNKYNNNNSSLLLLNNSNNNNNDDSELKTFQFSKKTKMLLGARMELMCNKIDFKTTFEETEQVVDFAIKNFVAWKVHSFFSKKNSFPTLKSFQYGQFFFDFNFFNNSQNLSTVAPIVTKKCRDKVLKKIVIT